MEMSTVYPSPDKRVLYLKLLKWALSATNLLRSPKDSTPIKRFKNRMSNLVLELNNVSKRYRSPSGEELFALKNVNLTINTGEFVIIMGPSGSGQTTFGNFVGLLSEPSDGPVQFLHY